jgi:hypothetical protein
MKDIAAGGGGGWHVGEGSWSGTVELEREACRFGKFMRPFREIQATICPSDTAFVQKTHEYWCGSAAIAVYTQRRQSPLVRTAK